MLAALVTAALAATTWGRSIPASIAPVERVVWVSAGDGDLIECGTDGGEWTCRGDAAANGVVVATAAGGVAAWPRVNGVTSDLPIVAEWGRLIVAPAASAGESLTLSAETWQPVRSAARPRTTRFARERCPSIEMAPIGRAAVWIAGSSAIDRDAYLVLAGSSAAAIVPLHPLRVQAPEDVLVVELQPTINLEIRIDDSARQPVENALVEVFAPLASARPDDPWTLTSPAVQVGSALSGVGGSARFEHLVDGRVIATATHREAGRGQRIANRPPDLESIVLTPPLTARGRILDRNAPVVAARVRFVPDADALVAAQDPSVLLAEETASGADGRFALPLPPSRAGTLQVVAPSGAALRVPLGAARASGGVIDVGELVLPRPPLVRLRFFGPPACGIAAIGPLGALGLSVVRADAAGDQLVLALPESGQWALSAECPDGAHALVPGVIDTDAARAGPIDIRFAARRTDGMSLP